MAIRGRHPLRRRHRRLPSAFGRRLSVGGRWEPRGHRPVFFLVFRLAFSTFLRLGLGLPSAFGVVEVEAGRVEVRRDGEGEVDSRLALLKAPMLLSLLRRLGAGTCGSRGRPLCSSRLCRGRLLQIGWDGTPVLLSARRRRW
jgi:hypothetical protein